MSKIPQWALGPHDDLIPGVEVRLNDDGTIDEIVTSRPCTFHLEQMDDGQYWIGLTPTTDNPDGYYQSIVLTRHRTHIFPTVYL